MHLTLDETIVVRLYQGQLKLKDMEDIFDQVMAEVDETIAAIDQTITNIKTLNEE